MKKLEYILAAAIAGALGYGFVKALDNDGVAKFEQERDNHVIQTWENAPDDFHGHNCQYGDWCTRSYYEHLKNTKKHR